MKIDKTTSFILGLLWTGISAIGLWEGKHIELWQPMQFIGLILLVMALVVKNKGE